MSAPWLSLLTFTPLAGALALGLAGGMSGATRRSVALAFHGVVLAMTLWVLAGFDASIAGYQFEERRQWAPSLGVEYRLGIDGLGAVMLLLAGGIPGFSALFSARVAAGRERLYYSLLLGLQCGLMGTFTALNFFHWFLFWEISLVPAYFLVRLFGGPGRGAASFQFFLYTMVGSVALLLGFLALRAAGGSFDFQELAEWGRSGGLEAAFSEVTWAGALGGGRSLVGWVFAGVLLAFAVKVPLWPFHTWLPSTYSEAPSPVTMTLTGALSKMGVYGLLRIALPIFPEQFREAQAALVALALATVVLPVFAAFAQSDLKKALAYSSVNHLGYCLLAVFLMVGASEEAWAAGLNGVVLQILNHGITAATLFACVEALERRSGGARDLTQFGGLRRVAPVFCGLMGISLFASVGLPGLNGFVSEFLIFKGVFAASPWAAAVALVGLLGTAVFLLTILQKLFHGPLDERAWGGFPDLTWAERAQLAVPVALMLAIGVFPGMILRLTNTTILNWAGGN